MGSNLSDLNEFLRVKDEQLGLQKKINKSHLENDQYTQLKTKELELIAQINPLLEQLGLAHFEPIANEDQVKLESEIKSKKIEHLNQRLQHQNSEILLNILRQWDTLIHAFMRKHKRVAEDTSQELVEMTDATLEQDVVLSPSDMQELKQGLQNIATSSPAKSNLEAIIKEVYQSKQDVDKLLASKAPGIVALDEKIKQHIAVLETKVKIEELTVNLQNTYANMAAFGNKTQEALLTSAENAEKVEFTVVKEHTLENEEAFNISVRCKSLLSQIATHALPGKDSIMEKFLERQQLQIINKYSNLTELGNVERHLQQTLTSLQTDEVPRVLTAIEHLKTREHIWTVGVQKKVSNITQALYELPLEQRGQVLSGEINNVQKALAARRPLFFGKAEEAATKDGHIDYDKAADTYKDAMGPKAK